MASSVETMHADADRRLVVGDDPKVTFAVCASAMSMVSPVWNRMFKLSDANASYTWRDTGLTEHELKEDDPDAFRVILMAVHFRFKELRELCITSFEFLESIAALCDKYDTAHLLKPWVPMWISKVLGPEDLSEDKFEGDLTVAWLNIACVFGEKEILKTMVRCIGREMEVENQDIFIQDYLLDNITPHVIAHLKTVRAEAIRFLLDAITITLNNLSAIKPIPRDGQDCTFMRCGGLIIKMIQLKLFSIPAVQFENLAIESSYVPFRGSISSLYRDLRSIKVGEDTRHGYLCDCYAFNRTLRNDLDEKWKEITAMLDKLCGSLFAASERTGLL